MEEKVIVKGLMEEKVLKNILRLGIFFSIGVVVIYYLGFELLDFKIGNAAARALSNFMLPLMCITTPIGIILIILFFYMSKMDITITDKRVYGIAAFGKRVDLPVDSISSVGTSWLKGIDVSSPSGTIRFKLIKNQETIHNAISNLLIERQKK